MSGERYYITAGGVRSALPGNFRPSTLSVRGVSFNLVRARGQTEVFDLSDGLPDPAPFVLTGVMEAASEAALSTLLQTWRNHVAGATAYDRNNRESRVVKGGALVAVPIEETVPAPGGRRVQPSNKAQVTITLIEAYVPTTGAYYF